MTEIQNELLSKNINALPLSGDLKKILSDSNCTHLSTLLSYKVHEWHSRFPGFNFHHQQELVAFILYNNLEEYLQEE